MKKLIIVLFLLCVLKLSAATGDITAITVETNGWQALITIEGLGTGGTYAMGLGANNTVEGPGANPALVLNVSSPGYDDTGATNVITRKIYGTKQVRKPYPDEATIDENPNAGNVILRIALSDYIYSGDKVTANVLSGLYTQGGNPNSATTGASVSNSSAQGYAKVIANWSWVPYTRITNSIFNLRAVAYHRDGQQGRPVRAVQFTVTDGTTTVTNTVTAPTVDWAMGDASPVTEYIGTLDGTGLTDNAVVTANFKAFPWVGTSSEILDTSTGTAQPTPLFGPHTHIYDPDDDYKVTVAVVDSSSGNNSTGVAVDSSAFSTNSPPSAFLNIGAAAVAIQGTNNANWSRNNSGAGIIFLRAGDHNWTGSSVAGGTTKPATWLTVATFPHDAQAVINTQASAKDINDMVKLENLQLTATTASGCFDGIQSLWIDNCVLNSASGVLLYQNSTMAVTRSGITNHTVGFRPFSTVNAPYGLVRGNSIRSSVATLAYTVLGNRTTAKQASTIILNYTGQNAPKTQNAIIANNRYYGLNSAGNTVLFGRTLAAEEHGIACVNNLFENTVSLSQAITSLWGDSVAVDSTNVIFWGNSILGQRSNHGYNDTGTSPVYHVLWSQKNNLFDDFNIKSDVFPTASGNRIGNWSLLYGVGMEGNVMGEITGIGAPGSFLNEFAGLNTIMNTGAQATNYFRFRDDQAYKTATVPGFGDYRATLESPHKLEHNQRPQLFDADGHHRGRRDPVGAFSTGNRLRGIF